MWGLGDISDFERSVLYCREVELITPADHPDRSMYLSRMANLLIRRFEETDDLSDPGEAMTRFEEVAKLTSPDHPHRAQYLSDLDTRLYLRARGGQNRRVLWHGQF